MNRHNDICETIIYAQLHIGNATGEVELAESFADGEIKVAIQKLEATLTQAKREAAVVLSSLRAKESK